MKRKMKVLVSLVLAVVTAFLMTSPAFSAFRDSDELPIVYVIGKVDRIYADKDDPESDVIYPLSMERVDAAGAAASIGKTYLNIKIAEASGKDTTKAWADYCDAIYDIVIDIFGEVALGPDGEPEDNSGIIWDWPSKPLKDTKKNGQYALYDYTFHYDWRLDMFHNAEILNDYIDEVLEVTGAPKCVLISRCYGCNLVTTYLNQYGSDKIDRNILYCSTANGSIVCGQMFSGELHINPDALDRYLDEAFGINPLTALITRSIKNELPDGSSAAVSKFINEIYEKVSDTTMPKGLLACFASMPGYWSMVNEKFYNKAKLYVFSGNETKYSKLIKKIDRYYNTITKNVEGILVNSYANGTKYMNITKYGNQVVPLIKDSDCIGDGIVSVTDASLGAVAVPRNMTLPEDYINSAIERKVYKYISPDKQIDSSTCLFPDYTWFAEGVEHFDFPESVDKLIMAFAQYDGQMTIYSDERFPQYASYKSDGNIVTYTINQYLLSNDTFAKVLAAIMSVLNIVKQYVSLILKYIDLK